MEHFYCAAPESIHNLRTKWKFQGNSISWHESLGITYFCDKRVAVIRNIALAIIFFHFLINEPILNHFILLKSDIFDVQYPRMSL